MRTILLVLISAIAYGQPAVLTGSISTMRYADTLGVATPCPTDTIKGVILMALDGCTCSGPQDGYFIAKCGGIQIGNFFGYQDVPTFIPAVFIRNDYMRNGKRQIREYHTQRQTGYFTDDKFKKLPVESVYGMIVMKRDTHQVRMLKEEEAMWDRVLENMKKKKP